MRTFLSICKTSLFLKVTISQCLRTLLSSKSSNSNRWFNKLRSKWEWWKSEGKSELIRTYTRNKSITKASKCSLQKTAQPRWSPNKCNQWLTRSKKCKTLQTSNPEQQPLRTRLKTIGIYKWTKEKTRCIRTFRTVFLSNSSMFKGLFPPTIIAGMLGAQITLTRKKTWMAKESSSISLMFTMNSTSKTTS